MPQQVHHGPAVRRATVQHTLIPDQCYRTLPIVGGMVKRGRASSEASHVQGRSALHPPAEPRRVSKTSAILLPSFDDEIRSVALCTDLQGRRCVHKMNRNAIPTKCYLPHLLSWPLRELARVADLSKLQIVNAAIAQSFKLGPVLIAYEVPSSKFKKHCSVVRRPCAHQLGFKLHGAMHK